MRRNFLRRRMKAVSRSSKYVLGAAAAHVGFSCGFFRNVVNTPVEGTLLGKKDGGLFQRKSDKLGEVKKLICVWGVQSSSSEMAHMVHAPQL